MQPTGIAKQAFEVPQPVKISWVVGIVVAFFSVVVRCVVVVVVVVAVVGVVDGDSPLALKI